MGKFENSYFEFDTFEFDAWDFPVGVGPVRITYLQNNTGFAVFYRQLAGQFVFTDS